ncbi:imidazolonepropionase-like amidohydrolase [Desulfofundulus luciae]|uniref:Imidazolonepropionase-like amidohydrolase n=1 Tax=Desulfofundulus luciae TaxID=74702 RepID=A0ABU0B0C8_9FIRM|nr:amidohydrolase family protein [Desulfofundulus luciae]MDQ0286160.1 imidazolonepropionase-like amidohydrolase [Desulfofundulus luciae]
MSLINLGPGQTLLIKASRIWRGTPSPPQEGLIYVQGGKVIAISAGNDPEEYLCTDHSREPVPVLELPNCTVVPGFIDCHVHLALDGRDFSRAQQQWTARGELLERVKADLTSTLERGIVAIRDGGDRAGIGLEVKQLVITGRLAGPLVLACGHALHRQGKYGSFLGPGLTPGELEKAVDSLARQGVDHLKILVSGIVSFSEYGRVGGPQFTREELQRIVYRARSRGLKVMAHASGDDAVRLAVEAGVDSIEHGYFISEESLHRMAAQGIAWVPTVIPVAGQVRGKLRAQYTAREIEVITRTWRRQVEMIKKALEMGVTLGVGTDAGATGVCHGQGFLEELLLYREAGLSPADILLAATRNGAAILGLEHLLGRIEPGRPAFLVAVEGNPWEDVSALARVKYVFRPARSFI